MSFWDLLKVDTVVFLFLVSSLQANLMAIYMIQCQGQSLIMVCSSLGKDVDAHLCEGEGPTVVSALLHGL